MKKFLSLTALFLICSASHADEKPTPPVFVMPESSTMAPRVTLQIDKQKYRGDEDIILNVTIENIDTKPLVFHAYQIDAIFKFEVVNTFGTPVPRNPVLSTGSYMGFEPWSIAPGKKRTGFLYLNRFFDLSGVGKYTVDVSEMRRRFDKTKITTKPLTFETVSNPKMSGWLD